MCWDLEFLPVANSAPGRGVAHRGGLREAQDDTQALVHTGQWDFRFCSYLNVLFPQGVYNKNKDGENRLEKETLKDRKSTRLNSSHLMRSRMPSSA